MRQHCILSLLIVLLITTVSLTKPATETPSPIRVCPHGQIEYNTNRATPRHCSLTAAEKDKGDICPSGYHCHYSLSLNQYRCCGVSAGCPTERIAFIAVDGRPQQCNPGVSYCRSGYRCTPTVFGNFVCCSAIGDGDTGRPYVSLWEVLTAFGGVDGRRQLLTTTTSSVVTGSSTSILPITASPGATRAHLMCAGNRLMETSPTTGVPIFCESSFHRCRAFNSFCEYDSYFRRYVCCERQWRLAK